MNKSSLSPPKKEEVLLGRELRYKRKKKTQPSERRLKRRSFNWTRCLEVNSHCDIRALTAATHRDQHGCRSDKETYKKLCWIESGARVRLAVRRGLHTPPCWASLAERFHVRRRFQLLQLLKDLHRIKKINK